MKGDNEKVCTLVKMTKTVNHAKKDHSLIGKKNGLEPITQPVDSGVSVSLPSRVFWKTG